MARKTLQQRIAFEGGKEFLAQLEEIGRTGERVFAQIAKAAKAANRPNTKLSATMGRVRDSINAARAAGQRLGKTFSTIGQRAARLQATLATVVRRMTALTAAALGAAAAITAVARSGARAVDKAAKTAEGLGLSIEQYSRLEFAASQAGVSAEVFGSALNSLNTKVAAATKVQKKLGDQIGLHPELWADALKATITGGAAIEKTAESGDRATQALKKLGVALEIGGQARGARDILLDLAEAFKRLPAGIEKAGLAAAIFGEDLGRRMLPFLNLGIAGVEALETESDRIANTLTGLQARVAREFVIAEGKLRASITGVKNALGLLFAPALTAAANRQTEVIVEHRQALLDLVNTAVPKAVALVEDLVAALSGRDADVRAKWILTARNAIVDFAQDVKVAWEEIIRPAFKGLLKIFDQIAVGINKAFGTDFTGRQIAIAAFVGVLLGAFSSLQAVLLGVAALVVGLLPQIVPLIQEFGAVLVSAFGELKAQIPVVRALIEDLVAAFQGRDQDVNAAWILEWRDAIIDFGAKAKSVWDKILRPMLDGIAASVNFLAGTDLTGVDILLLAIAGKLTGIFVTIFRIVAALTGMVVIVTGLIKVITFAGAVFLKTVAGIVAGLALLGITVSAGLVGAVLAAVLLAGAAIVFFWDEIKAGAVAAVDFVAEVWRRIVTTVTAILGELPRIWTELWSDLRDILGAIVDSMTDRLVGAFRTAINIIGNLLKGLAALARNAFKAAKSALGFSGGGAAGFSGGGAVTGPGGKTSDTIPARLSRGEFVIRAAAVDRYGPRLFAALNSLRLPKGALPGFSLGGLVDGVASSLASLAPMPMPAYAMGGAVAAPAGGPSGRPVTIVLDGQRFNLTAEDSVAESLTRTALGQQRRRAGRMPGWFGG